MVVDLVPDANPGPTMLGIDRQGFTQKASLVQLLELITVQSPTTPTKTQREVLQETMQA